MIESAARRLAHELVNRREAINRELSRNGVRFGIYKNGEYHDRLFPYDPVPRIIESDEYDELEKGLKQRVNALNAYLKDIYSDKAISMTAWCRRNTYTPRPATSRRSTA